MELSAIKSMEQFARLDDTVISLGQGIPALETDERIKRRVIEAITNGKTDSYSDPQGIIELRRHLAAQLQSQHMNYGAHELCITSGAIEALSVALKSVMTSDRTAVIVPTPVYSAYFKLIENAGATAVEIPLDEQHGWALNAAQIIAAIDETTAAILLCNPNNPTGTVYSQRDLEMIAAAAREKNVTIIVDEVYRNMVFDSEFYSLATSEEFKEIVIRVMSFSKDFSLTGWRIGYLQAAASRMPKLVAIHDTLINCAPVVSQYAALGALEIYDEIIASNHHHYKQQRDYMGSVLAKLADHLEYTIPVGAYFFFPRLKSGEPSNKVALDLLNSVGLVAVPGASFGMGGEQHLRLCFGRDSRSVHEGLARLERYFGHE